MPEHCIAMTDAAPNVLAVFFGNNKS